MKTKAELIDAVLENLQIKPATQPANPEDVALVNGRIQPTIDLLDGKNIAIAADVADLDQIPDAVFLPLVACVAYQCATPFMISGGFKQELEKEQLQAIRDITLMHRQGFAGKELKAQHFWRYQPRGASYNWNTDR